MLSADIESNLDSIEVALEQERVDLERRLAANAAKRESLNQLRSMIAGDSVDDQEDGEPVLAASASPPAPKSNRVRRSPNPPQAPKKKAKKKKPPKKRKASKKKPKKKSKAVLEALSLLPPGSPRVSSVADPPDEEFAGEPISCSNGDKEIREGTNLELCVDALRGRCGHWLTADGISEAIVALGLKPKDALPAGIVPILCDCLKTLRGDDYQVPFLWYRSNGRRFEYRITVDDQGEKEDTQP